MLLKTAWIASLCAALLISGAAAQDAPVYRWKDRDGRISYGTEPPPGVQAEPLSGRGSVTVVPAPPAPSREEAEARQTEDRIGRLEQELQEERRLRQESESRAAERARTRAECEEKYREECNDSGEPVGRRYIVTPQHRPGWEQQPYPRPPAPGARIPPHEPRQPPPRRPRPGDEGRNRPPAPRPDDSGTRQPKTQQPGTQQQWAIPQ